jgi:tetratricopeptide (TPR) repeat protein
MMFWKRLVTLSLLLGVANVVRAAAPASSTDGEVLRMEQAISEASEQGHLDQVALLRHKLAEYSEQNGYYLQAARQYELLLTLRPPRRERVRLSIKLGQMRDAVKDYRGAIQAYEDALHDDARSWDARLALGRAYANIDLFKQAEDTYRAAIQQNPNSSDAHREMAALYMKRGYLQRAQSSYENAIRLDPKKPEGYLGLADTYSRMSNFTFALGTLERGASIAPSPEYAIKTGDLYQRQGDWARAALSLEAALKNDAKRDDVRLNLVLLYDRLKRPEDANRLMKKLLASYPDSPLVHFVHAWVLLNRGDRAGANREALEVRRLRPTDLVSHYNDTMLERLGPRL